MAKKDRSSPTSASSGKRAKVHSSTAPAKPAKNEKPAPPGPLIPDNLKITRAPRKRKSAKPSDLNSQVTVHIISVPGETPETPPAPKPTLVPKPAAPPAPAAPAAVAPAARPVSRAPATSATSAAPATSQAPAARSPVPPTAARKAAPPQPAATPAPKPSLRLIAPGQAPAASAPVKPAPPPAVATPASATTPAPRHDSPPAGTPIDIGAPTPVHKSALNLTPMEQMVWAARLQKAKEVVAVQMKVRVNNGKLVRRYTAIDHDDGLFEIETTKGFYVVVLSKTGEYSIYWRHDRKAY